MSNSVNNKRIAKNTAFLYVRMLLVMVVALYTSRVVLNTLGAEDYGIYNIVAGVVVLFSFLNNALTNACQRYLNVAIAKQDEKYIQKVFSTTLLLHILLSLVVVLFAETVGLWLLKCQLNIPEDREFAASVAYQLAVLVTCLNILRIPYNAVIIANEHMSFFAYTSIVDVSLKLLIVWLLLVFSGDKLIIYSLLLVGISLALLVWYISYCRRHFDFYKFVLKYNPSLVKEICSFSGWNLFGSIADIGYQQGTNLILNVFCGVTLNATMGIANQIRGSVFAFTGNLQMAANPQIMKSYATGDYRFYRQLVCRISKCSYYLMLLICLPIILNVDFILEVWLKNPPAYCSIFTILILIFCMVDSLNGPLWVSMQAYGKIKKYQMVTSACLLLNLPLTFVTLKMGAEPYAILIIQLVVALVSLFIRMSYSSKYAKIPFADYAKRVIVPILMVTVFAFPLPYYLSTCLSSISSFFISSFASVICSLVFIYICGLDEEERLFVKKVIYQRILHKN